MLLVMKRVRHLNNCHTTLHKGGVLHYNILIRNKPMNYLCFVDGLLEYASSDPASFAHYQLVYAEEHKNADVQYLSLTDEEYDEMFPYEEDEE